MFEKRCPITVRIFKIFEKLRNSFLFKINYRLFAKKETYPRKKKTCNGKLDGPKKE